MTKMPVAVIMNMFYTGLGIARSLGKHGIPVIGLSAHRGIYGSFTRFADIRSSPDSREDPESLLRFLLQLGEEIGGHALIFPTRDDDALFLDRFRTDLSSRFTPVLPPTPALMACLDKFRTYELAKKTNVPVPAAWRVESRDELTQILAEVEYPSVLKPLSAHYWRKGGNWELVGARKAICVSSEDELRQEYERIADADPRVLIQHAVPGGDENLFVAACYMDRSGRLAAGFTAQKLLQIPQGFGTGCIVRAVDLPGLIPAAARLLEELRFTGIAEVEFKRDPDSGHYQLIEINPRPWDQHRLGFACGIDLIHIAYCDLAGVPPAAVSNRNVACKWVAEDVLFLAMLRSLWRRDGRFGALRRLAHGPKIYAIWSWTDPLPFIAWLPRRCFSIVGEVLRRLLSSISHRRSGTQRLEEKVTL